MFALIVFVIKTIQKVLRQKTVNKRMFLTEVSIQVLVVKQDEVSNLFSLFHYLKCTNFFHTIKKYSLCLLIKGEKKFLN